MAVLEVILAVIGLVALVLIAVAALGDDRPSAAPPVEDAAAPYREGLHAAIRMQRVAQDLEQQIYAEAAQHMGSEAQADASDRP